MFNKLFFIVTVVISFVACTSQPHSTTTKNTKSSVYQLDNTDISNWKADNYGMKQYVMAFLKTGPNRDQDSATAAQIQNAHLENIGRMAENGDLLLAGPFLDNSDIKGIYIFNVSSLEEAKKLTDSDPAIKAGRLVMELKPWYGSAALLAVNDIHSVLPQKAITE